MPVTIRRLNWPDKNKKNRFCQFTFPVTNFHINDLTLFSVKKQACLLRVFGLKYLPFWRRTQVARFEGMLGWVAVSEL